MPEPVNVVCIYHVKPGKEPEFERILQRHWPILEQAGLVSSKPVTMFRGKGRDGKITFVEVFQWKDENSSRMAHQRSDVLAIWGPMDGLTDRMEFLDVEPVTR